MGVEIDCEEFVDADYARFEQRLAESVLALEELLARPGLGRGEASLGAELELHLVDARGRPAPVNRAVIAGASDPRLAPEIDRFNLELNAVPVAFAGRAFSALRDQLDDALRSARSAAATHGARVVAIGLLPTLTDADLGRAALSDFRRYRALSAAVRRRRQKPFSLRIEGDEVLDTNADDVTFEGANASFQIHLRVAPDAFARTYNAAQLATAIALAVATNSPLFLGKRLWEETRIPLFRQSVDDRCEGSDDWRPARVSFGHGWVRRSALELFAESVALHDPLLPVVTREEPLQIVRAGGVPALRELRLHHGTVWRWNRAIYDDALGGHLRIEFRALPSGPSVPDMIANAAFLVGLTLGLAPAADELVARLTFGQARRSFYEAARFGLGAMLAWPGPGRTRLVRASELVSHLLPTARRGLVEAGVAAEEADTWLSIIDRRRARDTTGARWQRRVFDRQCREKGALEAATTMLEAYLRESEAGKTIDTWELASS